MGFKKDGVGLGLEETAIHIFLYGLLVWSFLSSFKTLIIFNRNHNKDKNVHVQSSPYIPLSYDVASWSEITPCNKIDKTTSGLQIYGKRYDVHNNVAYMMTKS